MKRIVFSLQSCCKTLSSLCFAVPDNVQIVVRDGAHKERPNKANAMQSYSFSFKERLTSAGDLGSYVHSILPSMS